MLQKVPVFVVGATHALVRAPATPKGATPVWRADYANGSNFQDFYSTIQKENFLYETKRGEHE